MQNKHFEIRGPGLTRAIQEAVSSGRELMLICDRNNQGDIVRIGFYFADEFSAQVNDDGIKWFAKEDIEVLPTSVPVPPISQARLALNYIDNRHTSERRFLLEIPLDKQTDIVFRNLFRVKRNSVSDFMIQVELKRTKKGKKKFHPIVRYDCAHGFIHRDLILSSSRQIKSQMPAQQARDAIPLALEDIKTNLRKWVQQLGWNALAHAIVDSPAVAMELDGVKHKLLELYEHPELMPSIQSELVQHR